MGNTCNCSDNMDIRAKYCCDVVVDEALGSSDGDETNSFKNKDMSKH